MDDANADIDRDAGATRDAAREAGADVIPDIAPDADTEPGPSRDPASLSFLDRGVVWSYEVDIGGGVRAEAPVSDPSVIARPGGGWRMTFTCFEFALTPPSVAICMAESDDGLEWEVTEAPALYGREPTGRHSWEGSAYLAEPGGAEFIFASWYAAPDERSDPAAGFPAELALARRGVSAPAFEVVADPLLDRELFGRDHDAIYSPSVTRHPGGWSMVYAGHCYEREADPTRGVSAASCPNGLGGVSLMLADAPKIEGPWTKRGVLDFGENQPAYLLNEIAEPSLTWSQGRYWIALTGLDTSIEELGAKGRTIGLGWADSLAGPWTFGIAPIVDTRENALDLSRPQTYVIAPSIIVEEDRVRVWYTAVEDDLKRSGSEIYRLGYAEGSWPDTE